MIDVTFLNGLAFGLVHTDQIIFETDDNEFGQCSGILIYFLCFQIAILL